MNKRQKILIVDDSKTVFMKEDLLPVMGDNQMIQDLPLHLSGFWSNRTHGKNNGKDLLIRDVETKNIMTNPVFR